MITFKQHLAEQLLVESKNLHLEHAEDEILNSGHTGARKALDTIEMVAGMLSGHAHNHHSVTAKWDGSPAIVAGTDPETGKFFVGTKSVFAKRAPKRVSTAAEADAMYGDKPELAEVLKSALKHLSKLNIKGVLQGDMMFGPGRMPEEKMIDGDKYLIFQPNTIVYAVPVDSELASKIRRAKFGIIFHTSYTGDTIADMKASFRVDVKKLGSTPDVWVDDASYLDKTGTVTLTAEETQDVRDHVIAANKVLKLISEADLNEILSNKPFIAAMKIYINSRIREGQHYGDTAAFVTTLETFIHDRIEGEKVKPDTKQRKKDRTTELIERFHGTLLKVVEFMNHTNEAKLALVRKLNAMNRMGTFLQTADGFKVTSPEGFVAVDHLTNRAIKLVDRLEFSRANFSRER
jgi:hypothetical protein